MKIHTQWRQHVEDWRESGLNRADYCRQHGLNHKTFLVWTRRVQSDLSLNKEVSLELISVQVASSAPAAATEASAKKSTLPPLFLKKGIKRLPLNLKSFF
jgi:hypothetical protein